MYTRMKSLVCLFMIGAYSCVNFAGECETTATERSSNKSGTIQAVKVVTDCGATTTPSSYLRIVESSDTTSVGESANSVLERIAAAQLRWKSDDTLVISGIDTLAHQLKDTVFVLKKSKGRVVIEYEK